MATQTAGTRRRAIIDAAIEVIATEGLARATTRRIAERAEVPLGALHYCFRSKEELIQVVGEEGSGTLGAAFADVDPAAGFEQTVRDCVTALWHWVEADVGMQLALLELAMWRIRSSGGADLYAMWEEFGTRLLRDRLGRALAADPVELLLPLAEIVRFINHRVDGLILEFATSADAEGCRRQTELLAEAILALSVPGYRASTSATP